MIKTIKNVSARFNNKYADFRAELGMLIPYTQYSEISIEGRKIQAVQDLVNLNTKHNGVHIIICTPNLRDNSKAVIVCVSEEKNALEQVSWQYIKLLNKMGRTPKIVIGDACNFGADYQAESVEIDNYGATYFIDFEI